MATEFSRIVLSLDEKSLALSQKAGNDLTRLAFFSDFSALNQSLLSSADQTRWFPGGREQLRERLGDLAHRVNALAPEKRSILRVLLLAGRSCFSNFLLCELLKHLRQSTFINASGCGQLHCALLLIEPSRSLSWDEGADLTQSISSNNSWQKFIPNGDFSPEKRLNSLWLIERYNSQGTYLDDVACAEQIRALIQAADSYFRPENGRDQNYHGCCVLGSKKRLILSMEKTSRQQLDACLAKHLRDLANQEQANFHKIEKTVCEHLDAEVDRQFSPFLSAWGSVSASLRLLPNQSLYQDTWKNFEKAFYASSLQIKFAELSSKLATTDSSAFSDFMPNLQFLESLEMLKSFIESEEKRVEEEGKELSKRAESEADKPCMDLNPLPALIKQANYEMKIKCLKLGLKARLLKDFASSLRKMTRPSIVAILQELTKEEASAESIKKAENLFTDESIHRYLTADEASKETEIQIWEKQWTAKKEDAMPKEERAVKGDFIYPAKSIFLGLPFECKGDHCVVWGMDFELRAISPQEIVAGDSKL